MDVASTIEIGRSKSGKTSSVLWLNSLVCSLLLSTILSVPVWAQSFEALGRWDSTYGRVGIKYIGTLPDGTEVIAGKFLYDKKKRLIGSITKGEFNRKTGAMWFEYAEPWGGGDKGRANFQLSKDKSQFVGTFSSKSGLKGPWVLKRPVAQSMIVYIPGKTQMVDFDNDDIFINMFGGDSKIIVLGNDAAAIKLPFGVKLVFAGGNKGPKAVPAPVANNVAKAPPANNAGKAAPAPVVNVIVNVAAPGANAAAKPAPGGKPAVAKAAPANNAAGGAGNNGNLKSEDQGGEDVNLWVKNDSGGPVRANWVDTDGKEGQSDDIIKPGEDKELGTTHPGHVYRVRETKFNSLLQEIRVPKGKASLKIVVPARAAG